MIMYTDVLSHFSLSLSLSIFLKLCSSFFSPSGINFAKSSRCWISVKKDWKCPTPVSTTTVYWSRFLLWLSGNNVGGGVYDFQILFILIVGGFSLKQNLKNNAIIVNLGNGAGTTPVSTTTVVLRDSFFREWMDKMDEGGVVLSTVGVQSVRRTAPLRSISLDAGVLAAQRNSGIVEHIHSTLTTTNHLEIVAGDVCSFRTHTGPPTILYRASSHDHLHSSVHIQSVHLSSLYC